MHYLHCIAAFAFTLDWRSLVYYKCNWHLLVSPCNLGLHTRVFWKLLHYKIACRFISGSICLFKKIKYVCVKIVLLLCLLQSKAFSPILLCEKIVKHCATIMPVRYRYSLHIRWTNEYDHCLRDHTTEGYMRERNPIRGSINIEGLDENSTSFTKLSFTVVSCPQRASKMCHQR